MNDILIDDEPITEEQLELLEPREILHPIQRPFERIISDNYTINLQNIEKNSRNNILSEINRLENIDFENDNVYDIAMGYSISLNDFLEDEDNFYPNTENTISRKVLFVYKKAEEISFSAIEKSQLLDYLKTDMRRNHIFFPCTSTSDQYTPSANFNDTFYVKLDIPTPFYFEIYDFINMMTSNDGVFYITPKLDNDGNQQIITKTISWGVSIERGDPVAMVSAKHCQEGSDIKIYTYELCSESNFPNLCKVSNRIKTRNTESRLEIINLLLTDEIYTRYLLDHEYLKIDEIKDYEYQNEDFIKEFKELFTVSSFDKSIITIILNTLNEYYKKIEHCIKSYQLRKEKRLNDQLDQALPYYTAKYILDQRKDEKNVTVLEAKNVSRQYLKEMQEKYIKDNPDLIFLNYYKTRMKDMIEVLQNYHQDPNLLDINNNRINYDSFMDIIFIKDKKDGEKINLIYSHIDKIDAYEQADSINRSRTRNIIYYDDGYFKDIKLDFIYLDTLVNILPPRNDQYQTPLPSRNDQYQTPLPSRNDQTLFIENMNNDDVARVLDFDEIEVDNTLENENTINDGVARVLDFDEEDEYDINEINNLTEEESLIALQLISESNNFDEIEDDMSLENENMNNDGIARVLDFDEEDEYDIPN